MYALTKQNTKKQQSCSWYLGKNYFWFLDMVKTNSFTYNCLNKNCDTQFGIAELPQVCFAMYHQSPAIYPTNLQVLLTASSGQWWWHWQDSFFWGGAGAILSPSFLVSMLSLPELRKAMLFRKVAVREQEKQTVLGCIARLETKALNYFYL